MVINIGQMEVWLSTPKIILLQDVYEMRLRKQEELAFYHAELEKLKAKVGVLNREIDLTNQIIDLIEHEKIFDIKESAKQH
jgi:cell division protein FtsB